MTNQNQVQRSFRLFGFKHLINFVNVFYTWSVISTALIQKLTINTIRLRGIGYRFERVCLA